jgi:ABC-type branched-subunit amino acid transport system permease subunit
VLLDHLLEDRHQVAARFLHLQLVLGRKMLVDSYDLLLGYTGIVSFAHTMFFGIGTYGVAIASERMGPGWAAVGLGLAVAVVLSVLLALLIGLFSLRVKAIFFAMITLAVATAFQTLASQLSEFTGGEDGLSFKSPTWLSPSFEPFESEVLGLLIDGKTLTYWLIFGVVEGVPVLAAVLTPDRWLLWLGVLFVLSVYYFLTGAVGRLRARAIASARA